jgi:hypothetical protein
MRGESQPENGKTSRSKQITPHRKQLGKYPVELMTEKGLEAGSLFSQSRILTPGSAQFEIGSNLQLGFGDEIVAHEFGYLLGIRDIGLVSVHLPGFTQAKGGQRIHDHVFLAVGSQVVG